MRVFPLLSFFLAAGTLPAQHGYTLADVENGGRLYRGTCSVCHGPDGDFIPGIDFGHGKFRRATDDESIERFIINGIPNTGMPSNNVTEQQAEQIVAYLRSLPAAGKALTSGGDAARGIGFNSTLVRLEACAYMLEPLLAVLVSIPRWCD